MPAALLAPAAAAATSAACNAGLWKMNQCARVGGGPSPPGPGVWSWKVLYSDENCSTFVSQQPDTLIDACSSTPMFNTSLGFSSYTHSCPHPDGAVLMTAYPDTDCAGEAVLRWNASCECARSEAAEPECPAGSGWKVTRCAAQGAGSVVRSFRDAGCTDEVSQRTAAGWDGQPLDECIGYGGTAVMYHCGDPPDSMPSMRAYTSAGCEDLSLSAALAPRCECVPPPPATPPPTPAPECDTGRWKVVRCREGEQASTVHLYGTPDCSEGEELYSVQTPGWDGLPLDTCFILGGVPVVIRCSGGTAPTLSIYEVRRGNCSGEPTTFEQERECECDNEDREQEQPWDWAPTVGMLGGICGAAAVAGAVAYLGVRQGWGICSTAVMVNIRRAFSKNVTAVTAMEAEEKELQQRFTAGIPPLAKQFLLWRRSRLLVATLVWSVALGFVVVDYAAYPGSASEMGFGADGGNASNPAFDSSGFDAMTKTFAVVPIAQMAIGAAFYAAACWYWADYSRSKRLAIAGWGVVFCIPFLAYFLPWYSIIDLRGMLRGQCVALVGIIEQGYPLVKIAPSARDVCDSDLSKLDAELAAAITFTGPVQLPEVYLTGLVTRLVGLWVQFFVFFFMASLVTRALQVLLPIVIGVVIGMGVGPVTVKLMFPSARVPIWLLVFFAGIAMPVVALCFSIIVAIAGEVPGFLSALLFTVSFAPYVAFPGAMLRARDNEAFRQVLLRRQMADWVLKFAGLVLLVVALFTCWHLTQLQKYLSFEDVIDPFPIATQVVKSAASFLATGVVFTDITLHAVHSVYLRPAQKDPPEVQAALLKSLHEIGPLFPAVGPAPDAQCEGGTEMAGLDVVPCAVGTGVAELPRNESEAPNPQTTFGKVATQPLLVGMVAD